MPFPEAIDNTMRSTFVACREKFHQAHVLHTASKVPSVHLVAGGAYAKGLERYRKDFYGKGLPADECLRNGVVDLIKEWGDYPHDASETKSLENMCLALEEHFRHWPAQDDFVKPYLHSGGEPAVEFTFALPIPGTTHPDTGNPILYCGRQDMLSLYNGVLFVEDDKTTSRMGAQWVKQWDLNSQITGYVWAAREHGYPVMGCFIRGLCIHKYDFDFKVVVQYRADWEVDRWLTQLKKDLQDMIRCYEYDDWGYDLSDSCNAYGGCGYRSLCMSETPEVWREANFTTRVWNPLEVIKEV